MRRCYAAAGRSAKGIAPWGSQHVSREDFRAPRNRATIRGDMPVRSRCPSNRIRAACCAVLASLAMAGCAQVATPLPAAVPAAIPDPPAARAQPAAPAPPPDCARHTERGVASWYGETHHGRPTASGAPFDMNALTAAHRTLPLGSRIRVTNAANGRSVELTVTDRGPYIDGRIVDVTRRAARELGFAAAGLATVRLEALAAC